MTADPLAAFESMTAMYLGGVDKFVQLMNEELALARSEREMYRVHLESLVGRCRREGGGDWSSCQDAAAVLQPINPPVAAPGRTRCIPGAAVPPAFSAADGCAGDFNEGEPGCGCSTPVPGMAARAIAGDSSGATA